MAATWAEIIGLPPPAATADGAALAFGSRTVRFVPAADGLSGGPAGGRTGIVAVDLHATDREHGSAWSASCVRPSSGSSDPGRITALTAAHTCRLRGGQGTKPLVR